MSFRQQSIDGITIRIPKTCDFWKVVDYLSLNPRSVDKTICQLLYYRFAPFVIEKSTSAYREILASSLYSLMGWEKAIREHSALNAYQYYMSFELLDEENNAEKDSVVDCDLLIAEEIFSKIVRYIENHLMTAIDDVIVETACTRYLPFVLKEDDPRFRPVSIESAIACETWANTIRTYAGLPPLTPIPAVPVQAMSYPDMVLRSQHSPLNETQAEFFTGNVEESGNAREYSIEEEKNVETQDDSRSSLPDWIKKLPTPDFTLDDSDEMFD